MMDFINSNAGLIGLLLFFVFFTVMAVWVYRPGQKKHYQSFAQIPLEENENDR